MPMSRHNRSITIIVVLMLPFLACGPGRGMVNSGSESHGLSNGLLFSAWNEMQSSTGVGEFLHLLIVVPVLEDSRSIKLTAWGGSAELMTFEASFQPAGSSSGPAKPPPIEYQLELIESTVVRTAGQEFDLLDGNLVICVLSETGPQVAQLPERVAEKLTASELLRSFKDGLEPDHPAQTTSLSL